MESHSVDRVAVTRAIDDIADGLKKKIEQLKEEAAEAH